MSGVVTEQAKADTVASPLGLYVHVPFCASTCDFCAFYQTVPTAGAVQRFLDGIGREAELVGSMRRATTLFWGGGTPGLLAPDDLGRLAATVRNAAGGTPEEWTVELAPGSVTAPRLSVLRDAGVTRVSMGVQSFQPTLLDALGRQHTLEQIYRAYDRVRAAGFKSVNIDLMFALPGQTAAEWAADVREAVALAPDHVSTYCLTFEEDTRLWVKLSQGRVKIDPEHEAALYRATWSQLADAGYAQYEISNFARTGHQCLHNLNTWRMNEWVGLGPSAASQYERQRGSNIADLDQWLANIARGERATEDRVTLTAELLAEDAFIFGLRMNDGVDIAEWQMKAPHAPWIAVEEALSTLVEHGLATRERTRIRLTDNGRLVADSVGTEIMTAFEPVADTA
jgi:oxygen-independent coproporphyrinogen III oxidase